MAYLGWMFAGVMLGWGLAFFVRTKSFTVMNSFGDDQQDSSQQWVAPLLKSHFHPTPNSEITITERRFPFRMRADLQRTIDKLLGSEITVKHFFGVRSEYSACCSHADGLHPRKHEQPDVLGSTRVRRTRHR